MTAPADDEDVVSFYDVFEDKGAAIQGYRLTVLTKRLTCQAGEAIRIAHVCESLTSDGRLYVMGPKPVWGEYVDDQLSTGLPPVGENPLTPSTYDGRVVPGQGIDANYETTEYRFDAPGAHTIQWRMDPFRSNILRIDVS